MKNEKGVTLIALVITIIVLIILAAVSIGMLTGDSGVASNAQVAKKSTEEEAIKGKIDMELEAFKTDLTVSDGTVLKETYDQARSTLGGEYSIAGLNFETDATESNKLTSGTITITHTETGIVGTITVGTHTIGEGENETTLPSYTITRASKPVAP